MTSEARRHDKHDRRAASELSPADLTPRSPPLVSMIRQHESSAQLKTTRHGEPKAVGMPQADTHNLRETHAIPRPHATEKTGYHSATTAVEQS